jgi:hypothetical protein
MKPAVACPLLTYFAMCLGDKTFGPVHIVANGVQTELPVPKHVVDAVPPSTGSHVVTLRQMFCFGRWSFYH